MRDEGRERDGDGDGIESEILVEGVWWPEAIHQQGGNECGTDTSRKVVGVVTVVVKEVVVVAVDVNVKVKDKMAGARGSAVSLFGNGLMLLTCAHSHDCYSTKSSDLYQLHMLRRWSGKKPCIFKHCDISLHDLPTSRKRPSMSILPSHHRYS